MNPSVDAIQEFSVQSRGNADEQGRSMGSDIVVATRSGTNSYHGSMWEFLRNSKLDARNFFDPSRPDFKQNQYGVHVRRSGQAARITRAETRRSSLDTTKDFGLSGLRTASATFQPMPCARAILRARSPSHLRHQYHSAGRVCSRRLRSACISGQCNSRGPNGQERTGSAESGLSIAKPARSNPQLHQYDPAPQENNQGSVRVDQRISASNTLFGRISYNDGYNAAPGGIPVGGYHRHEHCHGTQR